MTPSETPAPAKTTANGGSTTTKPFPSSRKIYVPGTLHPFIRVPMREIMLTSTPLTEGSGKNDSTIANGSVTVYDTSGAYTDSDQTIDLQEGLPPLRLEWILAGGDVERYVGRPREPEEQGYRAAGARRSPLRRCGVGWQKLRCG